MGLKEDLGAYIGQTVGCKWTAKAGRGVPDLDNIPLVGGATTITGTVLYADLADSTGLVNRYTKTFAAEVFKTFLHCSLKLIESEGGVITAFDGDRIMAVFMGDTRSSSAARAALKLNHAVFYQITPAFKRHYSRMETFQVRHGVGIDDSELLVAKTGVRGTNDLVWIGRAANYAAKLCSIRDGNYNTWITKDVYDRLSDDVKRLGNWESRSWDKLTPPSVFRSNVAVSF